LEFRQVGLRGGEELGVGLNWRRVFQAAGCAAADPYELLRDRERVGTESPAGGAPAKNITCGAWRTRFVPRCGMPPTDNRPPSVTVIAWVYIAAGAIGFVYHFGELWARPFRYDPLLIEFVRVLAIVAGVFVLRGRNWARWLALAWIGFHVILSAFHPLAELAIHCLFFALTAWALFRGAAARYFR
jgi:hypothetical protein